MGHHGLLETPYAPPAPYVARGEASGAGQFGLFGSEYSCVDIWMVRRMLLKRSDPHRRWASGNP